MRATCIFHPTVRFITLMMTDKYKGHNFFRCSVGQPLFPRCTYFISVPCFHGSLFYRVCHSPMVRDHVLCACKTTKIIVLYVLSNAVLCVIQNGNMQNSKFSQCHQILPFDSEGR
jgi:hypothetical protein